MEKKSSRSTFQPLVIGGDALGYTYVRSFAKEYGVKTIVLGTADIKFTSSSKWADYRTVPNIDRPDVLLKWLENSRNSFGGRKPLLLGGTGDWNARTFSKNKAKLESWGYVVPYIDFDLLDRLTQKDRFYALCDKLGVPYPQTDMLPFSDGAKQEAEAICSGTSMRILAESDFASLSYPVGAKPSNSAAWHYADIKDKHKFYKVNSAEELAEIYHNIKASSYDRCLLIQEYLNPKDEALRSITTFSVKGEIKAASTGHVLVQDRSASGIGNPMVIISEKGGKRRDLLEYVGRILKDCSYDGFANFDVMNGMDGKPRVLEVNTRPGRNSWYMTLAGCPFVIPMVEHYVYGENLEEALTEKQKRCDEEFLFTMLPKKIIRQEVTDPEERERALSYFKRGIASNPILCRDDTPAHILWSNINYYHGYLTALNKK
ncbi:MAG: hypothetical protein U0L49_07885 [Eubacterium sp.]|nr:hypothetical protein [Eubacterium sp.]